MDEKLTFSEKQRILRQKKIRKNNRRRTIITCILILLVVSFASLSMYFYYLFNQEKKEKENVIVSVKEAEEKYNNLKDEIDKGGYLTIEEANTLVNDAVEARTEDIRSQVRGYMEGGEGVLTMLENLFPSNIVVPDTGRYQFFDIDKNLKLSELDYSLFKYPVKNVDTGTYEGQASYESDDVTAHRGIDVSKFQGKINWNKVKADGIDFAYIRLGYRGYESGKIVLDDTFENNIKACNDIGLDCGVYFFTEAKTEAEGREEAEFVLENLEEYHTELPIVIDVEESANKAKSRTKNLTQEERTKIVIAFCERIKEAGYVPMIYGNLKTMMIMTDIYELEDYDKWFAYYHYPLRFPYKFKIWQYTSAGNVDGIDTETDINLMFY